MLTIFLHDERRILMRNDHDKQLPIVANTDDIEDLSLRDLQNMADVVIKKGNKTTIQAKKNNVVIRADIIKFPASQTMSVTRTETDDREALEETVRQQLKNGVSQADIALSVGLSQSSVSRIKRKNKN